MDRSRVVSAVALVLAAATAASAQNAIGDGRRLDRNLLRGSGRANPAGRDLAAEVRFRNAIVTGNAPGGLSFRGDAGYRAPGEFLAPLGSNNLFAFRRDSAYSGLAGLGLRGTDALQYQFALTVGNSPPQGLMGAGTISRSGGDLVNRPGAPVTRADAPVTSVPQGQPGADMRGTDLWVLRSPAAFVSTRSLQPALLAVLPGEQPGQQVGVSASSLRGLTSGPLPKPAPVEPPPGSSRRMDLGAGGLVTGAAQQEPGTPDDPNRRTGYQDLMDRMAARGVSLPARTPPAGTEPQSEPEWRRRLNELKKQLDELGRPGADRPESVPPGTRPAPPDPGTVELLRDPGGRITRLAPSGFDAYAVHMQRGQQLLREGQYFAAEERFTAALGARPDDPMAAIGRVHAQLGASLYGSAAANLRALLVTHPELAGARYGADLFPDAATSGRIIGRLGDMVASGGGVGPETALLLAYVGYQAGDARAVERGLEALQNAPGAAAVPAQLKELGRVLRGVWSGAEPEK